MKARATYTFPLLLNILAFPAIAETEFDPALDATLDFDMPVDIPTVSTQNLEQEDASLLGKNLRLSFGYQVGSTFDGFPDIVSNRLDTRLRWEKLFANHLYGSLDGKLIVRGPRDQQLDGSRTLDADLRVREAALQLSMGSFAAKAGYQTVIWGEMDSFRITDIMTPWDYSEFAFTAPEDARVGQPSIMVDWFSQKTSVRLVATPLPMTNRYPGGDASGLLAFVLDTQEYHVNQKLPQPGKDYEIGARLKHNIGPSDIAFYAARVVSDDPLFNLNTNSTLSIPDFNIEYKHYDMLGFSANYSQGNFLWKTEAGFKNNLYIPDQGTIIRDSLEGAVGVDYNANAAYSLSLELLHQYILPGEGSLLATKPHNTQATLRWSKNFLHDTLAAVYYASYQFQFGDTTHSATVQYSINDFLRMDLNATVFVIENQESPYRFVDDWDMLSLRVTLEI